MRQLTEKTLRGYSTWEVARHLTRYIDYWGIDGLYDINLENGWVYEIMPTRDDCLTIEVDRITCKETGRVPRFNLRGTPGYSNKRHVVKILTRIYSIQNSRQ